MKTLGFIVITLLSGEQLETEEPVNCDHWFDVLQPRMATHDIAMIQCRYTAAPARSPRPVVRPTEWRTE